MVRKIISLEDGLNKQVSVEWKEEIRRETFIDHSYSGILVQISDFRYEIHKNNKKIFGFSYNDFRRGIIKIEII